MLCDYMSNNMFISGSMLQRIVKMNKSPIVSMFVIRSGQKNNIIPEAGLADTLHNLLLIHDNYVEPWTDHFNCVNICIVLFLVFYTMSYTYMLYCFYFSLVEIELK